MLRMQAEMGKEGDGKESGRLVLQTGTGWDVAGQGKKGGNGMWTTKLADCLAGCRELETADRRGGAGVGGSETRGWIND